jgi:hypothetical protein
MESPRPSEDQFTKNIEKYTAAIPSTGYLAVAIGAMALSLACQVTGRGKWGNFIGQWVPTWLIIGLYNKLVKLMPIREVCKRGGNRIVIRESGQVRAAVDTGIRTCSPCPTGVPPYPLGRKPRPIISIARLGQFSDSIEKNIVRLLLRRKRLIEYQE